MLEDQLVQSPHCPHGGTEKGRDLDSGELDKMANSPASLTNKKTPACVLPGREKTVPGFLWTGMWTSQQSQAQSGWRMGQAGPDHLVKGPWIPHRGCSRGRARMQKLVLVLGSVTLDGPFQG